MKHKHSWLAVALVLTTSLGGFGNTPTEQTRRVRLQELRASTSTHIEVTLLERAFLDAVAILDKPNRCSQFFGGSDSTRALSELVVRLQTRSANDYRLAVRMSGRFGVYGNDETGVLYRLFERSELNRDGAFFRAKVFPSDPLVPNVGNFRPNTREARVLILLHELAHLIQGSDGEWLIPDDGGNPQLSRFNTLTVESRCGEEIRAGH